MKTRLKGCNALMALVIAATAAMLPAASAQAQAHDHGATALPKLSLDQGRKWATDTALRDGMGRIRALVEPQIGAAHAGRLTPAQLTALSQQVETEVGGIVANCKLEPKADAMLHVVIGEIAAGADAMAGRAATPPAQGLARVALAVNDYGRYFEHPGFRPIRVH